MGSPDEEMEFEILKGKTLKEIRGKVGDGTLTFFCEDGEIYQLYHYQNCEERVIIEDICGDLRDLIGAPLLQTEVVESNEAPPGFDDSDPYDSHTWTFYKLSTIKGCVTIRWYGESNGYYSEKVDFRQL